MRRYWNGLWEISVFVFRKLGGDDRCYIGRGRVFRGFVCEVGVYNYLGGLGVLGV